MDYQRYWQRNGFGSKIIRAVMSFALAAVTVFLLMPPTYADQSSGRPTDDKGAAGNINQFGYEAVVPNDVWQAAREGLKPFLQAIPVRQMELYGFPQGTGFDGISLAQPYRVFTIHPVTLLNSKGDEDIRTIITPTQNWLFPVVQNGETRAILTVDLMNGKWKAVSLGCPKIAEELSQMEQAWPDINGYRRILLRIYQAASDFLLIIKDASIEVSLFTSAQVSLNLPASAKGAFVTYAPSEIVQKLIPIVSQNLNDNRE